jgi:hypothetical protein
MIIPYTSDITIETSITIDLEEPEVASILEGLPVETLRTIFNNLSTTTLGHILIALEVEED